jgi:RNA ligase
MITLSDFNDLKSDPRIRFKTEVVDGVTVTIVCYMIADSDLWSQPLALETRGIAFNESGQCISRPLHKFFNVGERPETQPNVLDFEHAVLFEKRDGSMLVPVIINDKVFWKSKKSFFSDVAIKAQSTATQNIIDLSVHLINAGYTPIFEFTHPEHQIVIDYGNLPTFTLLAARSVETGEYLDYATLMDVTSAYGVYLIPIIPGDSLELIADLDTIKNFEGYVVRHPDGTWTKAKSRWYLLNHRIMTELRERDIAIAVLEETIDDIKSSVSAQGLSLDPILEVEHRVVLELEELIIDTKTLVDLIKLEPTQKDAALKYRTHPNFGLAMSAFKGSEPDFKKAWKSRYWKQNYSLRVVYNQNFSGDEA